MRTAQITRKTLETDINLSLNLDGSGSGNIDTSCGFLDHMLTLFACHGKFDLSVSCVGDIKVDFHHTVEDVGIALGTAFKEALGEKKGISRYGSVVLPMDEALILSAVDISGRGGAYIELDIPVQKVGEFDIELCEEFFIAFARESGITMHIKQLSGKNSHHIIEGAFKSVARSFRTAVSIDKENSDTIPSTKGLL